MSTSLDLLGSPLHDLFEKLSNDEIGHIGQFIRDHVLIGSSVQPKYIPATSGSRALSLPSGQKVFRGQTDRAMFWELPAHGDKGPNCGNVLDAEVCPTGEHGGRLISCHCDKLTCPICSPWTINRKAHKVASGLISAFHSEDSRYGYQHIVISPPQQDAVRLMSSEKGFRSMRGAVREVLAGIGCKEALAVFHPWRERDGQAGVWDLGPHFHAFGFGFIDWESDYVRKLHDLGWVIKVKPKRETGEGLEFSKGRFWTQDDLIRGVSYLLSHAGIGRPEGASRCSPAYFNMGGYVKIGEITKEGYVPCPVCREHHAGYEHVLHSLRAFRGNDPCGLTENRCRLGSSEIMRKEKHDVWIRKRHYASFLDELSRSYVCPHDLLRLFCEWNSKGVLGSTLILTPSVLEGAYIKVYRISMQGERVRGDVSSKVFRVIERCRGWTPEQYDAFEDECTVSDCTSARLEV